MNISNNPNLPFINPQDLLGGADLNDIKKAAKDSVLRALELLGTVIAGVGTKEGAPGLEPPKATLMQKVTDLTLRIALLQQALDELQTQVSKTVIDGRMKEVDQAHKEQLQNLETQLKEMKEAIEKQQEANKKGNVFQAIASWVMAAVDIVSAVFSIVAAAANFVAGNWAGTVGMIAAAGAQLCSAGCNIALAIDATDKAMGGDGVLSEAQKQAINGVMIGCAVVAGIGGLIGGLGGITMGLKEGMKAALKEIGKAGVHQSIGQTLKAASIMAKQAMMTAMQNLANPLISKLGGTLGKQMLENSMREMVKSTMKEMAKQGIEGMTEAVVKEALKATYKACVSAFQATATWAIQMAATQGLIRGITKITEGSVNLKIQDLMQQAADAMKEAELAEAAAKALEAMITLLKKTIEDLQAQLEDMLNAAMETMSILFQAIDDSAQTMTQLHQTQAA